MQRLVGILILAAAVATSATLFGFGFAPEAGHGHAAAQAEHVEHDEEARGEEHHDEEPGAGQVASAVLISLGGSALVPLTVVFARRRRPEEGAGAEIAIPPLPSLDSTGRIGLALLSIGAAVIHFAVIAQHMDEWWLTGMFFVVVALFQLAWAVAVLARPRRLVYLTGAAVNALVAVTWIVSRTVGVPVGPEAGEREPVGLQDLLATGYEVLLVAVVSALTLRAPVARRPLRPLVAAAGMWVPAVAVASLTGLALARLA